LPRFASILENRRTVWGEIMSHDLLMRLVEQSGCFMSEHPDDYVKFAELIVRECAAHLETTDYGDIVTGGNTVAEIAAVDLLELFGVDRIEP